MNAPTRTRARATPRKNRKSLPHRIFQLLLLWAFNMQAMWKTPIFSPTWSWKCLVAEPRQPHSSIPELTALISHTNFSSWKAFTLLTNNHYHHPNSLMELRCTVLLIRSSTLTFSITKKYLNCLNSKLMPSTCKDMTCLSAEIGYIRSTQTSSGIPHVGTTRMLAQ